MVLGFGISVSGGLDFGASCLKVLDFPRFLEFDVLEFGGLRFTVWASGFYD